MKNDKDEVCTAIKNDPSIQKEGDPFKFASFKIRNDKEFILKALRINSEIFKEISNKLQNDKEIYLVSRDVEHFKNFDFKQYSLIFIYFTYSHFPFKT